VIWSHNSLQNSKLPELQNTETPKTTLALKAVSRGVVPNLKQT
jgi:hypothetical protein